MKKLLTAAAAAALSLAATASAQVNGDPGIDGINQAFPGGNADVRVLANGNFLVLVGLEGADEGDILDLATVQGLANTNANAIVGLRAGTMTGNLFGDPAIGTDISGGVAVDGLNRADGTVFDVAFLELLPNVTQLVFQSLSGTNTVAFDPEDAVFFDVAPVPVPAALPLFAAGVAGGAWVRRRKAKAQA